MISQAKVTFCDLGANALAYTSNIPPILETFEVVHDKGAGLMPARSLRASPVKALITASEQPHCNAAPFPSKS